jgi:hypothetical protein
MFVVGMHCLYLCVHLIILWYLIAGDGKECRALNHRPVPREGGGGGGPAVFLSRFYTRLEEENGLAWLVPRVEGFVKDQVLV